MKNIVLNVIAALLIVGNAAANNVVSLNGSWDLTFWKQPARPITSPQDMGRVTTQRVKATVPGNAQLDLVAAGLAPDPYVGSNVFELRKWEGYQWCYSKQFRAPSLSEGQSLILHFGGIDCYADIYLNGNHVGSSANAMIEHDFDITESVKQGVANDLKVIIRSTVLEGQKHLVGMFGIADYPSSETWLTRTPPHSVGWDIMPRLIGIGLWRDVELRVLEPTHFRNVHHYVTEMRTAERNVLLISDLQFTMPFEQFDHAKMVHTVSLNGEVKNRQEMIITAPVLRMATRLLNAELWWPLGYGEQPLYDVKTDIVAEDGTILATDTQRIGLRTIRLDHNNINGEVDGDGEPGRFCFYVNNEPIFVRGTNWVPLDGFHSRDREKYKNVIAECVDLNINMIRCWGGNVYEDNEFFDLCDQYGILVWQDFAMACSFYSQRDEFARAIAEEVQSVVLKLRNHCSLAFWSGNNEDDMYYRLVHGDLRYDPNNDRISRHVIPQVLYEFDFTRPYLPSSPWYSPEIVAKGGLDKYKPEDHLWLFDYHKIPFFAESKCKFVSEIGLRGCPSVESIRRMMPAGSLNPRDPDGRWNADWEAKTTRDFPSWIRNYNYQGDYMQFLVNQIKNMFGEEPSSLEDFVFASQATQAEALKFFLEMWRARKWDDKTGMIWWNLHEGWPNINTGLVDYYGNKKLAYYYMKATELPASAFINDYDGTAQLIVANDTRSPIAGDIKVTDVESGQTVFNGNYTVAANGRADVADIEVPAGAGVLLIEYTVGGEHRTNHFLYGKAPFKLADYRKWMKKAKLPGI